MATTPTTTKPPEAAKPPETAPTKPEAAKEFTLVAVYGLMVDPHTGEQYTEKPRKVTNIPHWVDSQIKAGKILLK